MLKSTLDLLESKGLNTERAARSFSEVGEGWHALVSELVDDLLRLGWDGEVHQVKEKFGGLRFYIGMGSEAVHDRIAKAMEDSFKICEDCGEPGKLRRGGWLRTLCEKHVRGRKLLDQDCSEDV
jgi:hypothetical protein